MTRADSTYVETQIFSEATKRIPVPDCTPLDDEEMPYWDAITQTRASWSKVDLLHAANLARCMSSIEKNQILLKREGDVIINQRGTSIMNPRFTILEQLSRRSVTLSAKIHVHAVATLGEAKLGKAKNFKKAKAIGAMEALINDDDLITRPN